MIYNETFDYLWAQLAAGNDLQATRRLKDYQRKRLKRAQLALAIRSFFLEAQWTLQGGLTIGQTGVAATQAVTQALEVLDGAIRLTDNLTNTGSGGNNTNFEIKMTRTGGDSRVQPSFVAIKDEHIFTPAMAALITGGRNTLLAQGQPWPLTWPVPISLAPNELLQIESKVLLGGLDQAESTATAFTQFRAVNVNGKNEDDVLIGKLRDWIAANELQRPVYLSMVTEGYRSIVFPDSTATARTNAKTMEAQQPLLVIGYSVLMNRGRQENAHGLAYSATANPKWRLQSSDGWAFSKEEIDCQTFAFGGPGFFWQQLPYPFLLPQGSSLSASFSRRNAPIGTSDQKAIENIDNYVIFRCVTV